MGGAESTPNWDMTPYFAELGGPEYCRFRIGLAEDVAALQRELAQLGRIEDGNLSDWAGLLVRLESATARSGHLAGYLGCRGAADSRDEQVQSETASATAARVELEKVYVALRGAFEIVDEEGFGASSESAQPARRRLLPGAPPNAGALEHEQRARGPGGGARRRRALGLGRLYDQLSGKLEFELAVPGREVRSLPVSVARSLLEDPQPEVRRAALEGSNRAWERVGDVTAACLNAISGARHTLYARRGVPHFLDPALFDAGITRRTLDTLLEAVAARQEVARDYLRLKASLLGKDRLGFQDLMAPLPEAGAGELPWNVARERVLQAFGAFYPELADFAASAFDKRWIDYEPRSGKRPGGFCSTSTVIGESRVFITYNGTLGDLSTLAHELGHAYHGYLMRDMRPWARRYPMTLAETASTFAEQLVIDAVLSNPVATAQERALMLDSRLSDASAFLLNIPMRFEFEHALYEERKAGELSIGRLKDLMLEAQRHNYGDALSEDELDPWFWASKLHFYITGTSFYNFPYTFGYLFSLGIFARAKQEGPDFLPPLRGAAPTHGSDTAEAVARRSLGVDLESPGLLAGLRRSDRGGSVGLSEQRCQRLEWKQSDLGGEHE